MHVANYSSWGQSWGKYSIEGDTSAMQVYWVILKSWYHIKYMHFSDPATLIAGNVLGLKSHYGHAK